MLRLIHTADWQIGKVFRFVDDATMSLLQEARLEAIATIGGLAQAQGAPSVLVAGDLYDHDGLSDRTLFQPIERMRALDALTWHVIPGNHDADRPNGLWDRVARHGLPGNVRLHRAPEPCPLGDDAWAVRVHAKPFVRWIWLGALLMALGGFVTATDRRFRRTEVSA